MGWIGGGASVLLSDVRLDSGGEMSPDTTLAEGAGQPGA
jgi:hypothetical protein